MTFLLPAAAAFAVGVVAQQTDGVSGLSLKDAVQVALKGHPSIAVAAARAHAAGARIDGAKAGMRPRVQYTESFARSDNPVFVFGSLLSQRQFSAANFAISALNRPDFVNNFQSLVSVDQAVYDAGQTKANVRAAELREAMTQQEKRAAELAVIAGVARAYYSVVLAEDSREAAQASLKSAEADLKRAEAVREAGMSTDAEVLSVKVHVAAVKEQWIRLSHEREIAQAALNEALGRPLDGPLVLSTRLGDLPATVPPQPAATQRPELELTNLNVSMAQNQMRLARSGWLPQVGVRGVFEADRQRFVTRAGNNWMVAASLKWNLFDGFQTRARVREASREVEGAEAGRKQVTAALDLAVKQARIGVQSAMERLEVATAAVDMAQESLRIIQNRYEAGLTTVTELLRNESALLEARTRRLRAVYDARLARVQLEFAAGSLQGDSNVLE
jgi:outer membrane protein